MNLSLKKWLDLLFWSQIFNVICNIFVKEPLLNLFFSIVIFVFIFISVNKLSDCNTYYKTARNIYLLDIVLVITGVLCVLFFYKETYEVVIHAVDLVVLLFWGYYIIYGTNDWVLSFNDSDNAPSCESAWVIYFIGLFFCIVFTLFNLIPGYDENNFLKLCYALAALVGAVGKILLIIYLGRARMFIKKEIDLWKTTLKSEED